MPSLVDSVAMPLTRRGDAIHVFVHPIVRVRRDDEGRLLEVLPWAGDGLAESLLHVEIDRQAERASLDELAAELRRVLADVRAAVDDWREVRARGRGVGTGADERPPPGGPREGT